MREGLMLVQLTGAYYGYAVTRVGWLQHVGGDEWELHGAVTVMRTGERKLEGLDELAAQGPGKRYQVSAPSKAPEMIHRLLIRRALVPDTKAWARACPRPEGWVER